MATTEQAAPSQEPLTDPVEQWTAPHVDSLAICCSDGRLKQMTDQFLRDGLKIADPDMFVVPGGPGWLTVSMFNHKECDVGCRWVEALIKAHSLKRVALIAHEDCAFYKEKCKGATPLEIQKQQIADLKTARDRLARLGRTVEVEMYYADIVEDRVTFKRVK